MRETFSEGGQQAQRDAAYRQKVIDTFFQYGKLQSIPVQRKKERIVLEEIVKSFAFGRIYSEKEVNLILAGFHEDFCQLRRDLVSEQLMERDSGNYWRVCPEKGV